MNQQTLRKGDIIRVTIRSGTGKLGKPVRETIQAEVLGIDKDTLYLLHKNTDNPNGEVVLEKLSIPLSAVDLSRI